MRGPVAVAAVGVLLGVTAWAANGIRNDHAPGPEHDTSTALQLVDATSLNDTVPPADTVPFETPGPSVSPLTPRTTAPATVMVPDPVWVARVSRRTGIPMVALRAYGRASLLAAQSNMDCRLGWTTLAAIGEVESDHGRFGGAVLGDDGRSSRPVIGPALDGKGVAALPSDALGQRWHGDPTWDHAVGPMQFLPRSWVRFGADADGDGVADPTDIDDAAWGAARHLCSRGERLDVGGAWSRAVLDYNPSNEYALKVFELAQQYAREAGRR
ncbi:lytic transglycosylase domain-containing protein [Terrabacter carboxydivorans]|uniref:Lytic murein transglycosylase n=1 Tax=Terrabacter carboxydivorans TaxID=619730 RepID=A0ABN3MEQ1_9MICO